MAEEIREKRLTYFRSKTNSEVLDDAIEAETINNFDYSRGVPVHTENDYGDDVPLQATPNESEDVVERGSADSHRPGSSPAESQLEDIDIEQCDFVSEESKTSPEDELIELLKAASVGTSPEQFRESFDEAQVDQLQASVSEDGFAVQENEYDANVRVNKAESGAESDSSDDIIERFEASLDHEQEQNLDDKEQENELAPEALDTNDRLNKGDWKSDTKSDSSDDVIERFEASLGQEDYPQFSKEADLNVAHRNLKNEDERHEMKEDSGTVEDNELDDTLLTDTSANIDDLVARLGEIEDELSDSEEEQPAATREKARKSSDEEFEEIERLLYEEKARIAAEEQSKRMEEEETLEDSSDEEFKQLEKALYEQKVRNEADSKSDGSNEEFTKTGSDEEFEKLEKMTYSKNARPQVELESVLETNSEELKSRNIATEKQKPLSPPNLPVSPKNVEEDDLLDIIGSSDSDLSLSSEDEGENLGEVGKLILAQSSDDRETLGSDEEKAPDKIVTWTVSTRASAPAPPISVPVASEHNVAFVSIMIDFCDHLIVTIANCYLLHL